MEYYKNYRGKQKMPKLLKRIAKGQFVRKMDGNMIKTDQERIWQVGKDLRVSPFDLVDMIKSGSLFHCGVHQIDMPFEGPGHNDRISYKAYQLAIDLEADYVLVAGDSIGRLNYVNLYAEVNQFRRNLS
jgi:hypothetical protein